MADRVLGGRYRMIRHLAHGGMAEVYLGHDQFLDRPVAVKVLFPKLARDESFVERFRREAQSAARLNHPNIVSVYDFGEDEDAYFIVMEYVAGKTLGDVIAAEGSLAPARAIEIGAGVAAGLAVAHAAGIIHRDVKPANVLLVGESVKVADFGIARAADARHALTMPGTVVGTATYLSPEQAQGLLVDERSDIYSLGMVIYEMLTGWAPFRADNPVAVAYKQQHQVAPPPSAINPTVPAPLDAVVARAIAIDPADRHASADELRAALLAVGPGPVSTDPTVASASPAATAVFPAAAVVPPTPRRSIHRRRRLTVLAALGVLLLAAIGAVMTLDSANVSKSTSTVTVPSVVGRTVAVAITALDQAGLKAQIALGNLPGPAGQVLDQAPAAGANVARGTTVSVFLPSATTTTTSRARARPRATSTTPTTPTTRLAPVTTAPTVATVPTPPATTAVATTTASR